MNIAVVDSRSRPVVRRKLVMLATMLALTSLCSHAQEVVNASRIREAVDAVEITDNGKPLDGGVFTLNNQAQADDDLIQLAVGRHRIAVAYFGDRSFEPSVTIDDVNVTN